MIAGEAAIYVFGLVWLSRYVGWGQVLALGFFPFLIGDAVKLIAAALIVPAGWRIRER
jgi:biotin transport system substrate-specific component